MIGILIEKCGMLLWPQLALNVAIWSLIIGYLVALSKRDVLPGQRPWEETLMPLGGLSVTLGLLGSVIGFVTAFSGFQKGVDVSALARGLSIAYWTTGVGIASSLSATLGSYVLNQIRKKPTQEVSR